MNHFTRLGFALDSFELMITQDHSGWDDSWVAATAAEKGASSSIVAWWRLRRLLLTALMPGLSILLPLLSGCAKPKPKPFAVAFATTDGTAADVFINGQKVGSTPYSWPIHPAVSFDPTLSVAQWPPGPQDEIYEFLGGTLAKRGKETLHLKVAVAGGTMPQGSDQKIAKKYPNLAAGEQILFLQKETDGGTVVRGAIRFRIVDKAGAIYRHSPDKSEASENSEDVVTIGCQKEGTK